MIRPHPLESIKLLRGKTDSVIVAFSRGKDSIAALDLCSQRFARVEAFYCYFVPGLSFEEKYLAYAERRWNLEIHRRPHWFLASHIRAGWYRTATTASEKCPNLKEADIFNDIRIVTGIDWIVTGRKANDSLWRRSIVANNPSGLFEKRREAWPLAWWTNQSIFNYLKLRQIPLPADYRGAKESVGAFNVRELEFIKTHYPNDFARIAEFYPLLPSLLAREEFRREWDKAAQTESLSGVHDAENAPAGFEASSV